MTGKEQGSSLLEARLELIEGFSQHGFLTPGLDARLLLEKATGLNHAAMIAGEHEYRLNEVEQAWLRTAMVQRLEHRPMAYILKSWDFWDFTLGVDERVLTPRPETECVVEEALKHMPEGRDFTFADFGTGSGALLFALLHARPQALGLGVDISESAMGLAQDNARRLGLAHRTDWLVAHWADALDPQKRVFDLVVSNPPYIKSGDIRLLMRDVRDYEPHLALDGGADGLEAYRRLIPAAARLLVPGGWLIVEMGADQEEELRSLFSDSGGFTHCSMRRDYAGHPRVMTAQL